MRRGWDVRLLMLHEGEPGAGEFARVLAGRGVPVEAIRLRADVDPRAFARLTRCLARRRPVLLHTHLVHADVYGQPAAWLARVPVRFSTKHGFNEFRENPRFALADRLVGGLADTHMAVSRGLAQYLAADGRVRRRTTSRSRTTAFAPSSGRAALRRSRRACSPSAA